MVAGKVAAILADGRQLVAVPADPGSPQLHLLDHVGHAAPEDQIERPELADEVHSLRIAEQAQEKRIDVD
jgi:hypothetical protein